MASRQFTNWLADQNASLSFTTYQVGKVFLLGLREDRKISLYERTFNRCMGLYADQNSMYLSSLYQLWQFQNVLGPGQTRDGFDRLYVPQSPTSPAISIFTTPLSISMAASSS